MPNPHPLSRCFLRPTYFHTASWFRTPWTPPTPSSNSYQRHINAAQLTIRNELVMQGLNFSQVQVYLPPNTHKVSHKSAWAKAHKDFVTQYGGDSSYLFVYCDGSERQVGRLRRSGYGAVGYCNREVVFEVKGKMKDGAKLFKAETHAFRMAIAEVLQGKYIAQRPTRLLIFGDDIGSIERLTLPRPIRGQHYSGRFRKHLANVLLRDHPLETVISWCPGHCGIIGSDRADYLAKMDSLSPAL
jgi:ribonuclease HI